MTKTSTLSVFSRVLCLLSVLITLVLTGCATSTRPGSADGTNAVPKVEPLTLREGDTVRIDFTGAPSLNAEETIKRDGKIALRGGEVTAAGKTIAELQQELLDIYGPQLVTKQVIVSLKASLFPVYVTGSVGKNGRLTVDRPMTALEAVMEAGVDLNRANLKGVRVTRVTNGKTEIFMLNLDRWIKGRAGKEEPFYVKPSDIIYVPQKFQWF
ncbi:MAG: polysaccharide biosynthesis/export family protein [Akkermansiaceae bacterium]|nr:polysaccharide biosynthesis/export family protein [Verrucomicrobiales bacterium]